METFEKLHVFSRTITTGDVLILWAIWCILKYLDGLIFTPAAEWVVRKIKAWGDKQA